METQQNKNSGAYQISGFLKQMEDFFDTYLHKKAPFHLPANVKEWTAKFGPWIILVLLVFELPTMLLIFGIPSVSNTFMMHGGMVLYNRTFFLESLFGLAAFVLAAASLPGLFGRKLSGWRLLYYSVLGSALGELLALNIVSMAIIVIISMYLLFEMKEYYK